MFGMSLFMFLHYKFLKIFEYCTSKSYRISISGKKERNIWSIPGPLNLPLVGTKWIFFWQYSISQIHDVYASKLSRKTFSLKISQIRDVFFSEFHQLYGPIALEVTTSGFPIVHLYDRKDIEKVLRYPSKFPFRPPTEIVSMYRMSRSDRYASVGITNEQVHLLLLYFGI